MVDPIGIRPVQSVNGAQGASATRIARSVTTATSDGDGDSDDKGLVTSAGVGSLAKSAAASAPVDNDRVSQIRAAIANGTFPIMPPKIADTLIALKMNWHPHDAA